MRNSLKLLVLSLIANLYCYTANSQEVKDGFIVLPHGGYQYGFIKFDPALNVYEECLFSVASGKPFAKFTPNQVLGYGVIDGIHYITKQISTGETNQAHFLKKEIDELVKLYSFEDNRFFIEKDSFEELKSGNYKVILAEALKSCINILPSINSSHFNPQEIRDLLIKYQRCTDPESVRIPFKRFRFDIMAGAEFSNYSLSALQGPAVIGEVVLIDKTLFSAGMNAMVLFKKSKRVSALTGLYFYQQNIYKINRYSTKDYSAIDKINLDYKEVLVPLVLQYSFFKKDKRLMPYFKAGLSVPFTFNSTLIWESEKEYVNAVYFDRYELPQNLKQLLQTTISFGTIFNLIKDIKNVFEISYINGGGELKNSSSNLRISNSRFVVLLGYRF